MYLWTLAIKDSIVMGRTWEDFIYVCRFMSEWYELDENHRLVIYVHNLAYEFQFMHKWFTWIDVFSLKKRQPIKALCSYGIEFRCSYKLSGYSLAKLGDNLIKHNIKKLSGDLDYSLKRNKLTKLTDKELNYAINDVKVVTAYIEEYIERVEYIYNIPMTKTGEVRTYTRNQCFYNGGNKKDNKETYRKYRDLIKLLTLNSEEYKQAKTAFAGGFTHANALWVNDIIKNVRSRDLTSAYPYVMLSEKFPMSKPERHILKDENDFYMNIKNFCCMFDIEFINIRAKVKYENYISKSHCKILRGCIENNGRVVSADLLFTTITEIDYFIIEGFYEWDGMQIKNFRRMKKNYLPTNFVRAILNVYGDKTKLKGIEGKEIEYLLSKERLNSLYGMSVTDICRDKIIYNPDEWTSEIPDTEDAIEKNNKSKKRFLYYLWGVWVTAYNRFNLFTAIAELKDDYIYSDTDSVKYINDENHKKYFDTYNKVVEIKLRKAMEYHKLDINLCCPKNKKGEQIWIGKWTDEGEYSRFKTLGAKRYLTEKDNELTLTVAGLNKRDAIEYMKDEFKNKVFENFSNELYIPRGKTGKQTHTYIDEEMSGYLTDYQGNKAHYHEYSGIHLSDADYSLSMSDIYLEYLLGVQDEEI